MMEERDRMEVKNSVKIFAVINNENNIDGQKLDEGPFLVSKHINTYSRLSTLSFLTFLWIEPLMQ